MKSRSLEYSAVAFAAAGAIFCIVGRTTGQLLNHPIRASDEWRSNLAGEGKWTASLALNGSTITGTMQPEGWPGVGVGQVTGNLSASSIQLGVIAAGESKADFVGALTGKRY